MSFKLVHKPAPSPSKRASRLLTQLVSPVVPRQHPLELAAEASERWPDAGAPASHGPASTASSPAPIFEGAGAPLPESASTMLEANGLPPSTTETIRIHTGLEAGRLARALGARAATWGHDVAFAPGEYQPGRPQGMQLLRHEAFHASFGLPAFSLRRDPARVLDGVRRGEHISDEVLRSLHHEDLVWIRDALQVEQVLDFSAVLARIDGVLAESAVIAVDRQPAPNSSGTMDLGELLAPLQVEADQERADRRKREIAGKTGRGSIAVWEENDVGAEQLTDVALGLIEIVPEIADLDKKLKQKESADVQVAEDEAALVALQESEAWRALTKLEAAKTAGGNARDARKDAEHRLKGLEREQIAAGMNKRGQIRQDAMAEFDASITSQTNTVSTTRDTEEELEQQVKQLERELEKHGTDLKKINKVQRSLRSNRIQATSAAEAVVKARARAEKRVGQALTRKVDALRRSLARARREGDPDAIAAAEAEVLKYDFEAALQELQRNDYRLTEPAKQIVATGAAGTVRLRRQRSGKEGAVRQTGTFEFDDDDILRGIALASGSGPMREIDPNFRKATPIPDEFGEIFKLFMKTEGKPDSFYTDSAGGWTLATGFTGTKLAKLMAEFKVDDPEGYQRLFGQYGVEVTSKGKVSYAIPEGDYETTVADRAGSGPMAMRVDEASANEAFSAMRRDPKFLYMMATSTHDVIFRAEFTKFFWEQYRAAKDAPLEFQGLRMTWGAMGSKAQGSPEFMVVWLLPFIHDAIAGASGNGSIKRAEALLNERPELNTVAKAFGPAWWAAAEKLRGTTGGRWSAIEKEYSRYPWFTELTGG